jgi:hypothetical protein
VDPLTPSNRKIIRGAEVIGYNITISEIYGNIITENAAFTLQPSACSLTANVTDEKTAIEAVQAFFKALLP